MPGFILPPDGAPGGNAMNLDLMPSSTSERVGPLDTLELMQRATQRSQAVFGMMDPATGEQLAPPEPSVRADDLERKWSIDGPTPGLSLHFTDPLPESVAQSMNLAKRHEIMRANAGARSPGGVGSALADLGYGMLDPVGLAASALPVIGEGRMAALLGKAGIDLGEGFAARTALRAGAGAASGAAATVPLAALRYGLGQQEQADYAMYDAARDVAYGGLGGAILHPMMGAIGDALGRPRGGPLADPDVHAAATQAGVAAVMEDRPVDVAPVLNAEPAGPRAAAAAPTVPTLVHAPGVPPMEVRPDVVELDSLNASHLADGRVNQDFPHEEGMQPRDRTTAASMAQVRSIAGNLEPGRLGLSPDAGTGAPVVSPSGVVESGNGRVLALHLVYGDPALADRAAAYRSFLEGQGYDTSGMQKPVLVARRASTLTDEQARAFARASNERTTLSMSAAEQGRADADRAGKALDLWRGGDVGSGVNRDFVRAFMAQLPAEERGALVLPDGSLAADGLRRVQGAMLAHAYGDALGPTLGRMLNGDTEGLRAVAGALTDTAATWGQMRRAATTGAIPPGLDITPQLGEALRVLEQARGLGRPVSELLAQTDLERPPPSLEAQALLRLMFHDDALKKPLGRERVADMLTRYAEAAQKTSASVDMFGTPPATAQQTLAAMLRKEAGDLPAQMRLQAVDDTEPQGSVLPDEDARIVRIAEPPADDANIAKLPSEQQATLRQLYHDAAVRKPAFDQTMRDIAAGIDGTALLPGLKGTERAVAKIAADYDGDASRLKDLLRATIVVDTPEQAAAALAAVNRELPTIEAGRRDYISGQPGADGYRDIKVNVDLGNGLVGEVQINLKAIMVAKRVAHKLYERVAEIERASGNRERTLEEQAEIDELNARQHEIYSAAFAELPRAADTSRQNTSSDTAAPLRRADAGSNARGGDLSQAADEILQPGTLPSDTGIPSTSKNSVGMIALSDENLGLTGVARNPSARDAAENMATPDATVLRQAEAAAKAAPVPDALLSPQLQAQVAEAEAALAHARGAALLSASDAADLAALDDAGKAGEGRQKAALQAGFCVGNGASA